MRKTSGECERKSIQCIIVKKPLLRSTRYSNQQTGEALI